MKVLYQADNDLRRAIVRGAVRREPLMSFRGATQHHGPRLVPAEISDAAIREPTRRPLFALALRQFLLLAGCDIYLGDLRGGAQMARVRDADDVSETSLVKHDLLSIRGPTGAAGIGVRVRQPPQAGAVGMQ
jgi:hypothetical protein